MELGFSAPLKSILCDILSEKKKNSFSFCITSCSWRWCMFRSELKINIISMYALPFLLGTVGCIVPGLLSAHQRGLSGRHQWDWLVIQQWVTHFDLGALLRLPYRDRRVIPILLYEDKQQRFQYKYHQNRY